MFRKLTSALKVLFDAEVLMRRRVTQRVYTGMLQGMLLKRQGLALLTSRLGPGSEMETLEATLPPSAHQALEHDVLNFW